MANFDITKLRRLEITLDRAKVVDLGSGSLPRAITVELPGQDRPRVAAWWSGHPPNLAVDDYVRLQRTNSDAIGWRVIDAAGSTPARSGGAWPRDGKLMIDTTEYDTLVAAAAAATSGQTIKVGPGASFSLNNVTLPVGVSLVGTGVGSTIFSHTSHALGLVLSGSNYAAEFSIITNRAAPSEPSESIRPIRLAGGAAELFNVASDLTGSGSGSSCFCFEQASGTTALLRNCRFIVNSATVLTTRAAVATGATLKIEGGLFSGNGGNDLIITGAGGSIEGTLPALAYGTILNFGGGLTGSFVYGGRVKTWGREHQFQEISTPSNPPSGFNSLYFKAGGTLHRLDSSGNEVEVGGAWPFTIVNKTTGVRYTSLPTAVSAATAGDVLELGGDLTEDAVEVNKALVIRGSSPAITLTIDNSNDGLYITTAGPRVENLTIVNTTTGTTSRAIRCDESATLDRVIATCSGGNTRYGVYVAASKTVALYECIVTGSGGSSTDAGLVVDGTANVYGGKYAGDDYSLAVGTGTANLYGPHFANAVFNSAGTINGSYIDASGDLVQPGNEDIFPGGDNAGINQRRLLWSGSVDELKTFTGFTWATNLHFDGIPVGVDADTYPSLLWLYDNTDADEFFAYKTGMVYVKACLNAAAYCYGGIRIDDGGAAGSASENSVELRIVDSASAGLKRLLLHVHAGSSTPSDTYYADGVPPGFYVLQLYSTPGVIYGYWTRDGVIVQNISATAIGWTPSRFGILLGNSLNLNESVHYDWILMG